MSLTLKSVLTAGLLLLGFQAAAQDIPQAFQGKWAGHYEGKVSPKHIRALCAMGYDENAAIDNVDVSEDSGFYIEIGKKSIELNGWEWGAKYTKLNYRIYSPDKIAGTARVREEEPEHFIDALNPHSLEILTDAKVEPSLRLTAAGARYQFLRVGYFAVDPDTTPDHIVFNRIVGLKDSWSKLK